MIDPNRTGHLDEVSTEGIHGWAWDRRQPGAPELVDVFIDGRLLARVPANQRRADLVQAGIGEGTHGFAVPLPWWMADGKAHAVSAMFCDSDQALVGSPRTLLVEALSGTIAPAGPESWDGLDRVLSRAAATRRLAIMATFQTVPRALAYQAHLGRALEGLGLPIVVVRARAPGEVAGAAHRPAWADGALTRSNRGWDFGSWQAAWSYLGGIRDSLDELILLNDSVFGPLWPLGPAFDRMAASDVDFWGVTDSYEIAYHLQSYFLVLRRRALESDALRRLFDEPPAIQTKDDAVRKGEIGLTQALLRAGLRPGALCPYAEVAGAWLADLPRWLREVSVDGPERGRPRTRQETADEDALHFLASCVRRGQALNPTHFFWPTLLRTFRCPFLKRDLVLQNPVGLANLHTLAPLLREETTYPLELIEEVRRVWPTPRAPVG